jgi:hypothetical protein
MSTCIVCILSIFGKKGSKLSKNPMGAESISPVARKREYLGHTFSTPPGSPFRALPVYASPLMEPKCHRGEKEGILSVGHYLNFYA